MMTDAELLEQAHVARRYLTSLGMPAPALAALERLLGEAKSEGAKADIAWLLLGWYTRRGIESGDLEPLYRLAAWPPDDGDRRRRITILRARDLAAADLEQASALLEEEHARAPHADLLLARGNLGPLDDRVAALNSAFAMHGLSRVALDGGEKPALDRLVPAGEAARRAGGPLVSVVVPVLNSEVTVGTALASLSAQSWGNLEIIVVDDASTDATIASIEAAMALDPRIRLLRSSANAGAYVTRNRGFMEASGAFVTVHDADDWSHPEKIARQIDYLLARPEAVATISMKVRARPALEFSGLQPAGSYIANNASSLMVRRDQALAQLGSWDSVRVSADTEFIQRLETVFGASAVVTLDSGPLSVQRRTDGSLTRSGALAYPGFAFGARKEYGENGFWFRKRHRDRLRYDFPMAERPFPVPALMLPDRPKGPRRHDVVIASDFRPRSNTNIANAEEVEANAALGLSTGLMQLSVFDLAAERRRHPWLAEAIQGRRADMLVYGDEIKAGLVVIRDPRVLMEEQAYLPGIESAEVHLVVDRPPHDEDGEKLYDLAACDAYATRLFGRAPVWHPINAVVREALVAEGAPGVIDLSGDDWPEITTVARRGDPSDHKAGDPARIGRHGSEQPAAWPRTAEDILAVYPDQKEHRVSILGSIDRAAEILGEPPRFWKVGVLKRREQIDRFLSRLDAYIYMTRGDAPQFNCRGILEAMAAGVPVVLDPSFEGTFGELAVYAEPDDALAAANDLIADAQRRRERVDAARAFVDRRHSRAAYRKRTAALLERPL